MKKCRSSSKFPGKFPQKLLATIPVVAVIILIFAGMSFTGQENQEMPEADGKDLWEYIKKENPYTEWDNWPGHDMMHEGQSPHGAFLKLYVNEAARKAINMGHTEMPANAIIIKENYNKDKELVALTPMYKVKGYNPEAGDWFWAKYGIKGEIMAEGKVDGLHWLSRRSKKQRLSVHRKVVIKVDGNRQAIFQRAKLRPLSPSFRRN